MKRYQCTKTCQYAGRLFKEGDIYLSDSCDSPFFQRVGEFGDAEGDIKMNLPSEVIKLKSRMTRLEKAFETMAEHVQLAMTPVDPELQLTGEGTGEEEGNTGTGEEEVTAESQHTPKTSGRGKK